MSLKILSVETRDLEAQEGETMCKKYNLKAKRPYENEFTEWCSTDDYEAVKRNIKAIESYGYQWQLTEGKQCTDCKYFIGCECFDGQVCDLFERNESSEIEEGTL